MKNLIILAIMLIHLCSPIFSQNSRNVLALSGPGSTSHLWGIYLNHLENVPPTGPGYKLNDLFSPSGYSYTSTTQQNVNSQTNSLNIFQQNGGNVSNILGLGHDIGGLVLRGMAGDNRITANILMGTPNRGSNFVTDIAGLSSTTSNSSNLEKYIDNLLDARGTGVQCDNCNKVDNMKKILADMKVQKNFLSSAIIDPIGFYNTAPIHNNTVVIWGNAGSQGIQNVLGATSSLGNVDLAACQRNKVIAKKKEIKNLQKKQLFSRITGLLSIVSSIIGGFTSPDGKEGTIIKFDKISSTALSIANAIKADIVQTENIRKEIRDQMICEAFDNALEAAWKLNIANGKVEWVVIPPLSVEACNQANQDYIDCENEPCYDPDPRACEYQCSTLLYWADLACFGTSYAQLEPSDLLYSRTEQTIEGHQPTYSIYANHWQEQSWDKNGTVTFPLFDGSLGAAYQIPK